MTWPLWQELFGLLLAGMFGVFIGWLLRQLVFEQNEQDPGREALLRAEVEHLGREMAALRGRYEGYASRVAVAEEELTQTRHELSDGERHVRELEADLAVHARNSERAIRSDDEIAGLREGIRRAESGRRAAEDARTLLEAELTEALRGIAERDVGLKNAAAEVEALGAQALESRQLQLRLAAVTRDKNAELAALRGRVSEFETIVTQVREVESRLRAQLHDREVALKAMGRREAERATKG